VSAIVSALLCYKTNPARNTHVASPLDPLTCPPSLKPVMFLLASLTSDARLRRPCHERPRSIPHRRRRQRQRRDRHLPARYCTGEYVVNGTNRPQPSTSTPRANYKPPPPTTNRYRDGHGVGGDGGEGSNNNIIMGRSNCHALPTPTTRPDQSHPTDGHVLGLLTSTPPHSTEF
jgi:hypothetical protein